LGSLNVWKRRGKDRQRKGTEGKAEKEKEEEKEEKGSRKRTDGRGR
jgi:hypothetical protein